MTWIYHITHRANLPGILARGGLCCDRDCSEDSLTSTTIGYAHIKERRFRRPVTVNSQDRGVVADYVPFYFGPRSPMLYTINRGNVEGYSEGQRPIVHLVASAEAVADAGAPFIFSDRNAALDYAEFRDRLDELTTHVDLALMEAYRWDSTAEEPDRMERRMAEFLVRDFLAWEHVAGIGVMSQGEAKMLEGLLEGHHHRPEVVVRPGWYY